MNKTAHAKDKLDTVKFSNLKNFFEKDYNGFNVLAFLYNLDEFKSHSLLVFDCVIDSC